jgi:predicted alpha-1,2-mannosidase
MLNMKKLFEMKHMEQIQLTGWRVFSLSILRIAIGWHFLYEGLIKVMDPGWTALSFLNSANGPLASIFKSLASNPGALELVDFLNQWALVLIGLSLILGLFSRWASLGGMLLVGLYYVASPPFIGMGDTAMAEGNYLIVNKNLIEIFALWVLYFFPSSHLYGLDRFIRKGIPSFLLALLLFSACASEKQPVDYVNPFIGTKASGERKSTDGRTHPGACVPFGMTKWTPANIDNQSDPYKYVEDSARMRLYPKMIKEEVFGFRGSHYPNGSHMRDYGSYDFMPIVGDLKFTTAERASRISHDREEASPGYYSVYLEDSKTDVEITATSRCGFLRFSFPDTSQVHIIVDTRMSDGYVKILPEENRIIGYNTYSPFGRMKGYFVAEFSRGFTAFGGWDRDVFKGRTELSGEHVKAFVSFDTRGEETIEVKIGTSFMDFETAEANLEAEIGSRSFTTVRREAREVWNDKLSRIAVEGGSEEDKIKFYTSLYLVHFEPRISSSGNRYYSTFDEKIHETEVGAEFYNDFSLWDTYRNKHALLTYLEPKIEGDMIQSLVEMYKQGGWIPKWPNPGYSSVMIGAPATPVIVDAYLKGIDNFEIETAYEGMRKNAMEKPDPDEFKHGMRYRGMDGIEYYKELGYVPADKLRSSVSKTLENAFADWALAQIARDLGKDDDYAYFLERSGNYAYLYDTIAGYVRGRNSDGSWIEPYDPISEEDYLSKGPDFRPRQNYSYITEGTPLHWTWHVMHDPQGLIELHGGRENFIKKLEYALKRGEAYNFGEWNPWFNQTNQPVMHAAYLFNDAGAPWKTQKWIRAIMDKSYGTGPDGMIGNDDVGTMSAWYVFSAMGFYPVAPGELVYSLGSPVFDKLTIHLPEYLYGGKDFTVIAENNSPENIYIQSASLNGEPLDRPWIEHADIKNGSTLKLVMGNTPHKNWGLEPKSP